MTAMRKQNYIAATLAVLIMIGCGILAAQTTDAAATDNLIAIDVLLEPNQVMLDKANATNARLRENYSGGYALDATHAPHVLTAGAPSKG